MGNITNNFAYFIDTNFKTYSSVGTETGYGLDGRSSGVRFSAWAGNFFLHHRVRTGSGAHPATYSVGSEGFYSGVSDRGVQLTIHFLLVPRPGMRGAIPPLPQYAFMVWCSVEAQGQFYLYLYLLLGVIDQISHPYNTTGTIINYKVASTPRN
jgi:hypothetical protein